MAFLAMTKSSALAAAALVLASSSNIGGVHSFAPAHHPRAILNAHPVQQRPSAAACEKNSRRPSSLTQAQLFNAKTKEKTEIELLVADDTESSSSNGFKIDGIDEAKKTELILLGIWGVSISAFILINNFSGPFPLFLKQVPERVFFLSHMVGGMLFGGGIILTTCIERLVAKSADPRVLSFWFSKVPELDGLVVVPALTASMVSGTGLSIVRYGGLNVAPPHVGAIFWTLIAFMGWWAATDLTTQGAALQAVDEMRERYEDGEEGLETPKIVVDRHISNVVSCFFILILYSFMVLKPGTLIPFPWNA